jgi:cytochrome c biogenesis protein CcmG/thiol:disulfide interchange protein DsbE
MTVQPRWVIAGAAALAVGILALPMLGHRGGERLNSAAAGQSWPPADPGRPSTCDATGRGRLDFVLNDKYNTPVHLADYKGKVVLLNFWATWCGPCQEEIPEFVELYSKYKDKGLVIVGISIDDTAQQLQPFTAQWHMQYPVLQMKPEVEDEYGPFYGIPTTYLLARDGSICTKHLGPASKEEFEREIKGLLNMKDVL